MSKKLSYEELEHRVHELDGEVLKQKLAIKALEEGEGRFRTLTSLSPAGIYQTDVNGDCIYANDAWLKMAGMSFDQARGKGWGRAIHPDDRKAIQSAWYKMVASKGRWGQEYRFLSPKGKTTWVYGLATPIYGSDMNLKGYMGLNINITDRKRAEKESLRINQRLRTHFQNSPVALWEEDFSEVCGYLDKLKHNGITDFRAYFGQNPSEIKKCAQKIQIVDVNQAALQLHDARSKADLLGNLDKVFTERSFEVFKEELIALARGELEFEAEGEVRSLSGKARYIYLKLTIEKEREGVVRALLGTTDITERKLAEEALRESEARLSAFLGNSPIGIGLWDTEFRYIYLNGELQKMNGPSIKEHLGKSIEDILPKAAPLILPLFKKIISTGEPVLNIELSGELPSAPGQMRHFLVSYFPISIVAKKPQFIGGVVVDITERKQAEEALYKSEEKYRQLVELAQEGIWAFDKENKTSFVNPSMAKMLGYTPEEMLAKPLFSFMDEVGIERAKENLERRRKGRKEQHDFEFIRKDGSRILATFVTAPIQDDEGRYNGAIAGVIDITERKSAEIERLKLEAHLAQAQKMESIGNLAGGIAHDFNNILTSIIGFAELSLDDVEKGSELEDNLQEIYTAGIRAKSMVKQILAFARQSDEEVKPIRVNSIVREVLALIRSAIPVNIKIKKDIRSDALIMGNVAQVHQIIMNLCLNATQAMEQDGGTLEVVLKNVVVDERRQGRKHLANQGNYVEICVSDTGEGIAPEIIDKIFEPYFTTKGRGEGTGMGLAMVSGIVESYGGKISVESKSGHGALFAVCLPITKEHRRGATYESGSLPTGEERILFIDDEATIARMGGMLLERLGYSVTSQTSSVEALESFRSKPNDFDLVITDMTMPDITGDLLAMAMLKIRPNLPIILCTGYSKRISEETAYQLGIKAFVHKPLVKADFAKTVRKVLDEVTLD